MMYVKYGITIICSTRVTCVSNDFNINFTGDFESGYTILLDIFIVIYFQSFMVF